jgi:Na+-transporting NADH:ubiquinone oxidoreductase subunit D
MPTPQARLTAGRALREQLWGENPIFRQVLGICSTLAVTNLMFNTLLMCAGLVWATTLSSLTVSALRRYTPPRVRMMVQVLIIAVYVIMVDIAIRTWYPDIHRVIGPYVGLIITNCIVMGRLEAFASKNPVAPSTMDGLGAGLGYTFILMAIALVRETMGFGSVFGYALPAREAWWHSWTIMVMPPGAFFVLALAVWAARYADIRRETAAADTDKGAGAGKGKPPQPAMEGAS